MSPRPSARPPHEIAELCDKVIRAADDVDYRYRELSRAGWERSRHGAGGRPLPHEDGTPQSLADLVAGAGNDEERQALTHRIRDELGEASAKLYSAFTALQRAQNALGKVEDLIDLSIPDRLEPIEDRRARDVERAQMLVQYRRKVRQLENEIAAEGRRRRHAAQKAAKSKRRAARKTTAY